MNRKAELILSVPANRLPRSLVSRKQGTSPSPGLGSLVRGLFHHRALVSALLGRQLKTRYRGSVLGFAWTFLNPLLLMAVYALVFSFYLRIAVPNYAVFVLAGLLPWIWFSSALSEGTASVLGGGALVTKSVFPAEILPTVVVLNHMVNFLLSLPLLVAAILLYGITPNPALWLCFPLVLLLQFGFTLGLVLAVSALNVHYRDVQHIVANVLLLWFFLCPIVYPVSQVPEAVRPFMALNPMGLFAELYQKLLVEMQWPGVEVFGILAAHSAIALLLGVWIFNAYRDSFAELV